MEIDETDANEYAICQEDSTGTWRHAEDEECRGFGIFLSIAAVFLFTSSYTIVKLLPEVPASQLFLFRCCFQFLATLPYLTAADSATSLNGGDWRTCRFLVAQGVVGTLAALAIIMSVERISVADAITISFCSVVCTGAFAWCALGEALTAADAIFALLTVSGVTLIARPSFIFGGADGNSNERAVGIALALVYSVLMGVSMVMLRKIGRRVAPCLTIAYFSLAGVGTAALATWLAPTADFVLPCLAQLGWITLMSALAFVGNVALVMSLQRERAGVVALLQTSEIVAAFTLQITVLHDIPPLLSVIGSILCFLSAFGIAMRKFLPPAAESRAWIAGHFARCCVCFHDNKLS